jgi:hypothetical protein
MYHVVIKLLVLTEVNMKSSVYLENHLKMEAVYYSETFLPV